MPDQLFPYQEVGAEWLPTKKLALLADEMGLGKSAQAIRACDKLQAQRVLVLCPAVARLNWMREFEKFSRSSLSVSALLSSSTLPKQLSSLVTSYDLLASSASLRSKLMASTWDVLICDESHYLKNPDAKRTQIVFEGLAKRAKHVWCLSGTPAPNHSGELYPFVKAAGLFKGDYWAFVRRYCQTVETIYGTKIVGIKNTAELKALIAPVVLRRRKEEVLKDLPPIMFTDVIVEPSDIDYDRFFIHMGRPIPEEKFVNEIVKQQEAVDSVIKLTGLGQDGIDALGSVAPHVQMLRRYHGLQKVPGIVDIISAELEAGAYEKIVIFAVHRDVLEDLHERLAKYKPVKVYGGTPATKRDAHVRKFQNDPRCRVFLGNVMAAGTAINLTAAHQMAFVEMDWVPANNAQAAMRVHRIGQTKPVTVRIFSLANSTDEKVQRVLRRKTRDITALFDDPTDAPEEAIAAPEFVDPFAD